MDFPVAMASFGILFVMELGDKTQLAVLSLTARTGQPLAVFAAATLALTLVTLLGVVAGTIAGELIPMGWLSRLAGLVFIAIGGFMLWSSRSRSSEQGDQEESRSMSTRNRTPLGALAITFGLLFLAEMGDKTQIAVVGMTAKTGSPLSVFLGASLGLALVTILAVLAGRVITRIVPLDWVSRGAALLFIVLGLLTLADIP